jgi:Tfp pilus assembly protein PilO
VEVAIVKAVLLHLYRLRHNLGFAGLAGLAVAAGGLALYLLAVLPAERRAQSSAEQLLHLRMHSETAVAELSRIGDDAALGEFYGQFPVMQDLPEMLKTLHALAQKHGITLDSGDFKFGNIEGDKLLRYEITLPVKCSYPNMRSFVEEAAHKLPTMGLSEINLKREAVGDNMVQAKLDFVLYLSEN